MIGRPSRADISEPTTIGVLGYAEPHTGRGSTGSQSNAIIGIATPLLPALIGVSLAWIGSIFGLFIVMIAIAPCLLCMGIGCSVEAMRDRRSIRLGKAGIVLNVLIMLLIMIALLSLVGSLLG